MDIPLDAAGEESAGWAMLDDYTTRWSHLEWFLDSSGRHHIRGYKALHHAALFEGAEANEIRNDGRREITPEAHGY